MFIPYGDDDELEITPWCTYVIIIINIAIFGFIVKTNNPQLTETLMLSGRKFHIWQLLTSAFTHEEFSHLLGNMILFYIIADNIEEALGKLKFVLYYLSLCIAVTLIWKFLPWNNGMSVLGASGGISGLLATFVFLFPNTKIKFFYWFFLRPGTLSISSKWFILYWLVVEQLIFGVIAENPRVAIDAHLIGFVLGFIATVIYNKYGTLETCEHNIIETIQGENAEERKRRLHAEYRVALLHGTPENVLPEIKLDLLAGQGHTEQIKVALVSYNIDKALIHFNEIDKLGMVLEAETLFSLASVARKTKHKKSQMLYSFFAKQYPRAKKASIARLRLGEFFLKADNKHDAEIYLKRACAELPDGKLLERAKKLLKKAQTTVY